MRPQTEPFLIALIKPLILTGVLIATLVLSAAPVVAQPGASQDPVLTKSYLDQVLQSFFQPQREQLTQLERQLKDIEEKIVLIKSQAPPFTDVEHHWASKNIVYLYAQGVIGGFDDGTYKPNDTVTRAQLAAMLVRAKGIERVNVDAENPFADIVSQHWAYRDILTARQAGIIGGYPDGTFKPNQQVSRAEIAAMLARAFTLQPDRPGIPFGDVASDHWAKGNIETLANSGITGGYNDLTYRPANPATRAEVATFISRALDPRFR